MWTQTNESNWWAHYFIRSKARLSTPPCFSMLRSRTIASPNPRSSCSGVKVRYERDRSLQHMLDQGNQLALREGVFFSGIQRCQSLNKTFSLEAVDRDLNWWILTTSNIIMKGNIIFGSLLCNFYRCSRLFLYTWCNVQCFFFSHSFISLIHILRDSSSFFPFLYKLSLNLEQIQLFLTCSVSSVLTPN